MAYAAYLGGRSRTLVPSALQAQSRIASAQSKAAGGTGAFVVSGTAKKPVVQALVPGGIAKPVSRETVSQLEVAYAQELTAPRPSIAPRIQVDATPITKETLPFIAPKQEVSVAMGPESKTATVSTGDGKTVEAPVASVMAPELSVAASEAARPAPAAAAPAMPAKGGEGRTPILLWIAGGVAVVALVLFVFALRRKE